MGPFNCNNETCVKSNVFFFTFKKKELRGYARIDLKVNNKGQVYAWIDTVNMKHIDNLFDNSINAFDPPKKFKPGSNFGFWKSYHQYLEQVLSKNGVEYIRLAAVDDGTWFWPKLGYIADRSGSLTAKGVLEGKQFIKWIGPGIS